VSSSASATFEFGRNQRWRRGAERLEAAAAHRMQIRGRRSEEQSYPCTRRQLGRPGRARSKNAASASAGRKNALPRQAPVPYRASVCVRIRIMPIFPASCVPVAAAKL
jgi:hypothetical protein